MNSLRIKTAINFFDKNELIKRYYDDISDPDIVSLANIILTNLNDFNDLNKKNILRYMILQKTFNTNQFGVNIILNDKIILTSEIIHLLFIIYNDIQQIKNITVFGISYKNNIEYFTKTIKLLDFFCDSEWFYGINSFVQSHKQQGELIHKTVNNWLSNTEYYLGMGGEMGYYCSKNINKFIDSVCITNSESIYDDCNFNLIECYLVDYNNVKLQKFITSPDCLLINISKKGLTNLSNLRKQILSINFKQIIYIGCNKTNVNNDIGFLNNKYKIKQNNIISIDNNQNRYLYNLVCNK